ncbi:MAG: sulfurtransferase [Flavobacteriaceae bacterium]|nr:MAG: sulfurtransferase [Flavobacteriaceae bacterium]
MGPIIPQGMIPAEWDSIIAILIGIAFGFILESSGFSSSRKLAGVFYGYDFAVLKVFFTAALVAVIGVYYMDYLGLMDISLLYVHPTYLWAAIIGGAIMGVGFVMGGFCPGTSLCAIAIGKIDAFVYVGGILIGVFIFSESFGLFEGLYNANYLGKVTIMETFGITGEWAVFLFTLMAIACFILADFVRRRVKKIFY